MFQTEPILYLQSLGTEWFTFLMVLITSMGSSAFFASVIIVITFGIDFRKGFLLFQLLLWTGAVTEVLKGIFAFPRPDFVDSRVLNLEYGFPNTSPFSGMGADRFFGFPGGEALEAFRLQGIIPHSMFGFPSGHVSTAIALWGGTARIFENRAIKCLAPAAILLIAFSRMYLGRHFLGDVLGGATLGLIILIVFTRFLKSPLKDDLFKKESFELVFRPRNLFFYSIMFVVPVLLTALSLVSADVAGFFLGTNTAYLLIIRKGLPEDTGGAGQRATRVFIALIFFGVSALFLDAGFATVGTASYFGVTLIEFLKAFIPALTIWVSVSICTKLDLYGIDEVIESPGVDKHPEEH
ncbi:MAG: phosphatase PAP2 family protein [Methanosarcina sp.]|uniref:phosphatase PAP2 family protein n=1 Tax=Methanosarcina sp. TaxID=2213 RepID=UPI0026306E08|nr:phosphatase PAP2 family protein [Methanosarcina sp.]MDD3245646.1 phosphatase PAP2 family protein [Methanosarcina sp.]MDD4249730.1 phosphatase PAP2 family protein [Methanosarcina sp.]